ncbi:MAG: caspase family protein, partial [Betaproteobacteria bacterium]|nr:caspase family protein [Betaproteobacteria bacterium]
LYARHLVRFIRTPGLSLEQVFKRVREAVEQESRGAQVPVEFSTLTGGDFYFLTAGGK